MEHKIGDLVVFGAGVVLRGGLITEIDTGRSVAYKYKVSWADGQEFWYARSHIDQFKEKVTGHEK